MVGGGLAGLVCAYELEKAGKSVVVLEASERLGGRVATAHYGAGVQAEYGLQEIWEDNPLLPLARELGLPVSQGEGAWSGVLLDGQVHPARGATADEQFASYLTPAEHRALDTWLDEARALRARALQRGLADAEIAELQEKSFAQWLRSAHLPQRAYETVRLTIEVELGTSSEVFSALYGLLEFGVFLDERRPHSIVGGNDKLVDALAARISGPQKLRARVSRIERGEWGARVTYFQNQTQHVLEGEHVVVAVPFFMLHAIAMSPPLDAQQSHAVQSLVRGRYTVVHVLMKKEARTLFRRHDGAWPFPVLSDGPLGVIYGMDADENSVPIEVFSLLVYGAAAQAFHMVPRETKLTEIEVALERLWPGVSQYVVGSEVFSYHPGAIAVWPVGRSPLDAASKAMRESTLSTSFVGDWLYSSHSDGAVRSAQEVARRLSLPR